MFELLAEGSDESALAFGDDVVELLVDELSLELLLLEVLSQAVRPTSSMV